MRTYKNDGKRLTATLDGGALALLEELLRSALGSLEPMEEDAARRAIESMRRAAVVAELDAMLESVAL